MAHILVCFAINVFCDNHPNIYVVLCHGISGISLSVPTGKTSVEIIVFEDTVSPAVKNVKFKLFVIYSQYMRVEEVIYAISEENLNPCCRNNGFANDLFVNAVINETDAFVLRDDQPLLEVLNTQTVASVRSKNIDNLIRKKISVNIPLY